MDMSDLRNLMFCTEPRSSVLLNVILFRVPKVMLTRLPAPLNAKLPISKEDDSPIFTVSKLVQTENAYLPMLVTLLGILTVSKLVH